MKSLVDKLEDWLAGRNLKSVFCCRLVMAGAYFAFAYVKRLEANHVIVALLGQVNGEHGEQEHLLPTASSMTRYGIKV
jgi:hypothetical protein